VNNGRKPYGGNGGNGSGMGVPLLNLRASYFQTGMIRFIAVMYKNVPFSTIFLNWFVSCEVVANDLSLLRESLVKRYSDFSIIMG
jgi:hypothetical protein